MSRLITGLPRDRERATQQRLFMERANRLEGAIRREISRAMTAYAKSDRTAGSLAEVQDSHRQAMRRILERGWRSTFETFGGRILDGAQKSQRVMERKQEEGGLFSEFEPLIANWIRVHGAKKVTQIIGTTRDDAMDVINGVTKEAAAEGIGQAETGRRIRAAMKEKSGVLSKARSRVIARTETHAASQGANQAAAKATGLPMRKVWIASDGPRTRPDHDDADGQTRKMSEPFRVGGEELQYPGDPSGSARQVINCRCAVGYEVSDERDAGQAEPPRVQPDPQPPREVLPYESAPTPKNISEAENLLVSSGAVQNANLKGLPSSSIGEPIKAVVESRDRFDMMPLRAAGPVSRFARRKGPKNANAAIYPSKAVDGAAGILHLPTSFANKANAKRAYEVSTRTQPMHLKRRAALVKSLEDRGKLDSGVRERLQKMGDGRYGWSTSATADPARQATVTAYHEMGHVLHILTPGAKEEIDDFLTQNRPTRSGWTALISEYSGANEREYVAEAFAIYMSERPTEHYRIHPGLLSIFQKRDKKG